MEHPLLVNFLVIFFFSLVILFLSLPRDNSKKEDGHGSCSKSSKVLASKVYSAPRVFHVSTAYCGRTTPESFRNKRAEMCVVA